MRVLKRIILSIDYVYDSLERDHVLPMISVIGTVLFIIGVGYLMTYLVRIEEEKIKMQGYHSKKNDDIAGGERRLMFIAKILLCFNAVLEKPTYIQELKIHEFRAEKYNGLVRLLKPGCRTIVLIADLQSRPKLLPGFHNAIWPYRK